MPSDILSTEVMEEDQTTGKAYLLNLVTRLVWTLTT
jgi:hypothetical protein